MRAWIASVLRIAACVGTFGAVVAIAAGCSEDSPTASPSATGTAVASASATITATTSATASPTGTTTGTATATPTADASPADTATADIHANFPADVQPLLADVPDNVVELLWTVRQSGPNELIWADAGGEFHEGQERAFLNEWEQITGWTVQAASTGGAGTPPDFEEKVKAGEPEWDVVDMTSPDTVERFVRQDLLEKLDLSYFPLDLFPESSPYTDHWIDLLDGSTPLVYNTDVFSDPATAPTSVLDFFDTEKFPGKRCTWGFIGYGGNLEYALLADGAPPAEVAELMATPEGRARGYAKLSTIKDDLVFVDSGAESVQFPLDGQCDLGLTWNGRPALRLKDEPDLPLAVVHEDALVWSDPWGMPKGIEPVKYDAGLSALAYALQPQNQCDFENTLGYGVVLDPTCLSDFAKKYGPQPDVASLPMSDYTAVLVDQAAALSEEWEAWKTGE